ncbi:MAG TPA: hypothetical protein PKW58_10180 [Ottowia sp.]|nr:hypothetical protein [Ottowia sp.]
MVAVEHVGEAARLAQLQRAALEQVFAIGVAAAGFGHAQQIAQVEEMALRALLLVQRVGGATGTPFGNELGGGHGGEDAVFNVADRAAWVLAVGDRC